VAEKEEPDIANFSEKDNLKIVKGMRVESEQDDQEVIKETIVEAVVKESD